MYIIKYNYIIYIYNYIYIIVSNTQYGEWRIPGSDIDLICISLHRMASHFFHIAPFGGFTQSGICKIAMPLRELNRIILSFAFSGEAGSIGATFSWECCALFQFLLHLTLDCKESPTAYSTQNCILACKGTTGQKVLCNRDSWVPRRALHQAAYCQGSHDKYLWVNHLPSGNLI